MSEAADSKSTVTPKRSAISFGTRDLLWLTVVVAAYAMLARHFCSDGESWLKSQYFLLRPNDALLVATTPFVLLCQIAVFSATLWMGATRRLEFLEPGHVLASRIVILALIELPYRGAGVLDVSFLLLRLTVGLFLIAYVIIDHRIRRQPAGWPFLICTVGCIDLLRSFELLTRELLSWLSYGLIPLELNDLVVPCLSLGPCETSYRSAWVVYLVLASLLVAVVSDCRNRIVRDRLHWIGASLFSLGWCAYLTWRGVTAWRLGSLDYLWY